MAFHSAWMNFLSMTLSVFVAAFGFMATPRTTVSSAASAKAANPFIGLYEGVDSEGASGSIAFTEDTLIITEDASGQSLTFPYAYDGDDTLHLMLYEVPFTFQLDESNNLTMLMPNEPLMTFERQ